MSHDQTTRIQSFDRTECVNSTLFRPDRFKQLFATLSEPNIIVRGAGLSYCNAGVNGGGHTVLSGLFNRFLGFDAVQNVVSVEPGVSLGDLFEFSVSRNLLPPVMPGHPEITVGGALAMNAHGKNQFQTGNFGDHVRRIKLFHPRHGELSCAPDENAELFWLTVGGFGLTGHMLCIEIALKPLGGTSMTIERHKVGSLLETTELMESLSETTDYLYSWNDLNRSGSAFGCGIVYQEQFSNDKSRAVRKPSVTAAIKPFPWCLFNKPSISLMCRSYEAKENMMPKMETADLYHAAFPIVGKEIYYRLFGRKGFREYQALFPRARWEQATKQIEAAILASGAPISLASLKLFQGERRLLNFSGDGVCLALDTPNTARGIELFSRLDDITVATGGIAYIAKDSRLQAATVKSMYGDEYNRFRRALHAFDPEAHFQSELRRRLDV